ncbi:hypothetical protein ACWDXD_19975 [Streptomyces sp. NPDC003314]
MSVPTQQTEVRAVYVTCRLGKSELNRLFSLAPEGIPAAAVSISTQRDNTRYSAGALDDLVDHVRNSNASGNLDKWDNLALDAADGNGDRRVSINIDTERVETQVAGTDATWVHGQAARIQLLLKGAGGRENQEFSVAREGRILGKIFLHSLLITAVLLLTVLIFGPKPQPQLPNPEPTSFAPLVVLLFLFGVYGIAFKIIRRANRALLLPTAEVPHGSWWSRASSTDKIALSALIVATGSFLVAAATLGKDLAK